MRLTSFLFIVCLVGQSECVWPGIIDGGTNIIKNVAQGAGNALGGIANGTGNVIGEVAKGVGYVVGSVAEGAGNVVGGLVEGTGQVAGSILGTGIGILETGVDIFGNVIKGTLEVGSNVVGSVVDTGINVFCVAFGKIVNCKDAPNSGTIAPLPFQCRGKGDIVFVVDSSLSVGRTNYVKELSFAANLAGSYLIGPDNTRFGLVEFSSNYQKWFDLNRYSTAIDVMQAILNTPFTAGNTSTDKALKGVIDKKMFDVANGGRANANDVVIVITDGYSDSPAATAAAASTLKSSGVTVFAVGIGRSVNQNELRTLASKAENVFYANDFDLLNNVLYQLSQRSCLAINGNQQSVIVEPPIEKDITCQAKADIITVVDSSGSIGPKNYKKVLNFLVEVEKSFKIGKQDVQFGSVIFSNVAQKWFDLRDNQNLDDLRRATLSSFYLNSTTRTDLALDLVLNENMFMRSAGGRIGLQKIVILVTDGVSDKPQETIDAANRLKEEGVLIVSVGVGNANAKELEAVATSTSDVVYANSFDALNQIKEKVVQRTCENAAQYSG